MTLDFAHFTPIASLVGGALIGGAAALLILGAGRVLGASGVLAGALDGPESEGGWRWWLLVGLLTSPMLAHLAWGASAPRIDTPVATLVISGLMVGFGTRLGSGCTSGHGVCGLARFSGRSLVATATFLASGFVTVFVVRHVLS